MPVVFNESIANPDSSVVRIDATMTTDENGDATGTTVGSYQGRLIGGVIKDGETAPDNEYSFTVTDATGYDILQGAGATIFPGFNVSFTETSSGYVTNQQLTFTVGVPALGTPNNAKTMDVVLFFRKI